MQTGWGFAPQEQDDPGEGHCPGQLCPVYWQCWGCVEAGGKQDRVSFPLLWDSAVAAMQVPACRSGSGATGRGTGYLENLI